MFASINKLGGFVIFTAFLLCGCSSFRPEPYTCDDKVTAIEVGTRMELVTPDIGQPVTIRLNGVSASCYPHQDKTIFDVSVGLKITRDLAYSFEVSKFHVPFVIAVIDESETVFGHESFAYKMALSKRADSLYPVVNFQTEAPKDGRIILSLTTETIELEK